MNDDPRHGATAPGEGAWAGLVGTVLAGRYRILEKLGEGAMGAVYVGEHLKIGRRDAIKVLRPSLHADREAMARFTRGARNVSAIQHPNVCTVYDFGETEDGLQFLAMELIQGESLRDLMEREGPLPLDRALRIAEQVADALQAAHDAGIVHRDLKPANVMLTRGRDGSDVVKVVDFDIAKGPEEAEGTEVTRLGFVVGTPEYMSPEQLMGEKLDGRSDLYSLALLVFRMLTGSLPFRGETAQDIMVQRLTHAPLRLAEALPGRSFPEALERSVAHGLERRSADRPATVSEFKAELLAAVAAAHPPAAGTWGGPQPGGGAGFGDLAATRVAPGGPGGFAGTASGTGATGVAGAGTWGSSGVGGAMGASGAAGTTGGTDGSSGGRRTAILIGAAAVVVVALGLAAWVGTRPDAQPGADPPMVESGATSSQTDPGAATLESGPADAGQPPLAEQASRAPGGSGSNVAGAGGQPPSPPDRGGEPGGRPVETGRADGPPAAGTGVGGGGAPVASTGIDPANAFDALADLFDRVVGPPAPTRADAEEIRDAARAIWDMPGTGVAERAFAAHILGNAFLVLADTVRALEWLEMAVELRPDNAGYRTLYDLHRGAGR